MRDKLTKEERNVRERWREFPGGMSGYSVTNVVSRELAMLLAAVDRLAPPPHVIPPCPFCGMNMRELDACSISPATRVEHGGVRADCFLAGVHWKSDWLRDIPKVRPVTAEVQDGK